MSEEKMGFVEMMPHLEVTHNGKVGALDQMIGLALQDAIHRTMQTGKKSKLTISIEFDRESGLRFEAKASLQTKLPDYSIKNSRSFYRDKHGNISLEDNSTPKMFDADGEVAAPLKKVKAA